MLNLISVMMSILGLQTAMFPLFLPAEKITTE